MKKINLFQQRPFSVKNGASQMVPDRETGGTCAKCQKLMAGRTVDHTDQYGKNIEANQVVAYLA
ncbi:hypothetical protein PARMER_03287 [Parabacteroides merdae ATCC 43184]|nr:hypothetical protein PARMER_03287 [Parabacteroides merdae ATCC 43184]